MTYENQSKTTIRRRQRQKRKTEQIRKATADYLEGNEFGASISKIIHHIRPSLDFEPTRIQIGQTLKISDRFEKVSSGGTWILKKELEEENDNDSM